MKKQNQPSSIAGRLLDWAVRWHRNECGTIAFSIPVGLFFFMVFAGLLFNTGSTINGKIETQNAADASVYSASVSIARGLNAMTASNHLIGELNALYVLHHSLGGTWLDEKNQDNNTSEFSTANSLLQSAFNGARTAAQPTPVPVLSPPHDITKRKTRADINSTIYEAKIRLKRALAISYVAHGVAAGIYVGAPAAGPFAPAVQAGAVIAELIATGVQFGIMKEYLVLEGLELLAKSLKPFKKGIPSLIKGIQFYQQAMAGGGDVPGVGSINLPLIGNLRLPGAIPTLASKAAIKIAERNDASAIPDRLSTVTALGLTPPFPVEKETTTKIDRSQLMRASYPWVAFWTNNIAGKLKAVFHPLGAPISGAGGYFEDWTEKYAFLSCELFRGDTDRTFRNELTRSNHGGQNASGSGEKGMDIKLYVIEGLNETDNGAGWHKSMEDFNDWDNRRVASSKIDQLFCHVGFVRSENQPKVGVRRFFRQENPDGIICYAQSMVYNANPQQRPQRSGGGGSAQPTVGYDTLGWTNGVIEYPGKSSTRPRIKLNWQAKLTPITPEKLVSKAQVLVTDGSLRRVFWNSRESILLLNNH